MYIYERIVFFDQDSENLYQTGFTSQFCYPETKVLKDTQKGDCQRIVIVVSTKRNWRLSVFKVIIVF